MRLHSSPLKKGIKHFFGIQKKGFFLLFLILSLFSFSNVYAEPIPARRLEDYKKLWLGGPENAKDATREQIIAGEASGAVFISAGNPFADFLTNYAKALGKTLPPDANQYFDSEGNLKKAKVAITLRITTEKETGIRRAWNMVASTFQGQFIWSGYNNKNYLRLEDESFIIRIYQKDQSGNPIRETISNVPSCTFLDCENNASVFGNDFLTKIFGSYTKAAAKQGKTLPMIIKFNSGAAFWENFGENLEDGYIYGPDGGGADAFRTISGATIGLGSGLLTRSPALGVGGYFLGRSLIKDDGPVLQLDQTLLTTINIASPLEKGKEAFIELWYAGSDRRGINDGSLRPAAKEAGETPDCNNTGDPRIRCFKFTHNGEKFPYFQIGPTLPFYVPLNSSEAQTQIDQGNTEIAGIQNNFKTNDPSGSSSLPACDILNGFRFGFAEAEGTLMGCVAQVVHYAIYTPIKWFAGLMGNLFDFFLGYSLSDEAYRAEFVVRGWQIVRDISNIFFIIILIYTGLAAVFDIGGISMKRVVPHLIINAIIINFSLFATRVVVDISNITARVFYNTMDVCNGKCDATKSNVKSGPGGYTPLSEAIIAGFNPQQIMSPEVLDPINASGLQQAELDKAELAKRDTNAYAAYYAVVSLLAALITFSIAMMFWKTAFFFLGRVIGLYVAMIFSPFAFLTRENMPIVGQITKLSWKNWLGDLVNYALLAPIFILFLYIVYMFIDSNFMNVFISDLNKNFFENILRVSIPLLIMYFMLTYGVNIAKKYAGEIGGYIQNSATKVAGVAGGVALGAGALASSRIIGGAARTMDQSRLGVGIRNMAAKGGIQGWLGKNLQKGLNATQSGSFDVRQTSLGQNLFKKMGVNTDGKYLDALKTAGVGPGLSTGERKGGLDAAIKRREAERKEEAKLLEEKMDIDAYNKKRKKDHEKKIDKQEARLEKATEKAMIEDIVKQTGGTRDEAKKALANLKENNRQQYEQSFASTISANQKLKDIKKEVDDKVAQIKKEPPVDLRSADEMTTSRRETFIKNLKEGSLLTKFLDKISEKGLIGQAAASTIGTTIGAAIGTQINDIGDKKAAKYVAEQNKKLKEIVKIQEILKNGFSNLISIEQFKGSASFTNLTPDVQKDILAGDKNFYDYLTPQEKQQVDGLREGLSDDDKKSYMERVKVQQEGKYSMKKLKDKLTKLRDTLKQNPLDNSALTAYMDQLKDIEKARKHEETWRNVNRRIEELKKKMKEE